MHCGLFNTVQNLIKERLVFVHYILKWSATLTTSSLFNINISKNIIGILPKQMMSIFDIYSYRSKVMGKEVFLN